MRGQYSTFLPKTNFEEKGPRSQSEPILVVELVLDQHQEWRERN